MAETRPEDAQMIAAWPREWAKANDPARPGASKRRYNLRQRWNTTMKLAALRQAGAS